MADQHHENPKNRKHLEHLEHHEHPENPDHLGHPEHHEQSDVDIRGILGFGAGLLVVTAVVYLIVLGLFRFFDGREGAPVPAEYPLAAAEERREPPEPRLQTNPRQDLSDLRAKEDDLLGSYGWVDRNAGVVRIPIDAAMKLTLERGLPARTEPKR
jgi:hypothetical protein